MKNDTNLSVRRFPWLSLLTIAAVLLVGLGSWWAGTRNERHRVECKAHLKQIGLALHQYHEQFDSFPPAYVLGPDGRAWHSWRVLLLPFLGEESLHREYRFDEPWDGEHNRRLSSRVPECYRCPADAHKGSSSFLAIVGRRTMWPAYFTVNVKDVTDGSSNTVMLMEALDRDINWLEPRDLTTSQALEQIRHDDAHGIHHALFVDGAVRAVNPTIYEPIWYSLLTPKYASAVIPLEQWPPGLLSDEPAAIDAGPEIEVESIAKTRIVATTDAEIDTTTTVLWCATMQMAWDRLRKELQKTNSALTDVPVRGNPPLAAALNARRFPLFALASDAYELRADFITPTDGSRLLKSIESHFFAHNPDRTQLPENDAGVRLKASLHKNLPFETQFDRLPQPLRFRESDATVNVLAFGRTKTSLPGLADQVIVRDHVSDDDFVLEIITSTKHADSVLLAKIQPEATLESTWQSVKQRVERSSRHRGKHTQLSEVDELAVPLLRFHLGTTFTELVGRRIETSDVGRTIVEARQSIRFRLDEKGAELISVAEGAVVSDNGHSVEEKPIPRRFVLDKPFLLALRQTQADEPYFLAWITTTSLMERADDKK